MLKTFKDLTIRQVLACAIRSEEEDGHRRRLISLFRERYMDTPLLSASFQVIVGGVLVFLVGILIGSA
jgi:hypothetical protein